MNTYELTSKGTLLNCPTQGARLIVTWHKVPKEIYCYNALLEIPDLPQSLFNPPVIKVQVSTRALKLQNEDDTHPFCTDVWAYLPYTVVSDSSVVRVPLNSEPLIRAIALDVRTKNGRLKEYPYKISVDFGGEIRKWFIDPTFNPHQLCIRHSASLEIGAKMQISLNLES